MLDKISVNNLSNKIFSNPRDISKKNSSQFKKDLDNSISQQKALANEIQEQKNNVTKKNIEKLKKDIQEIQKSLSNQENKETSELISYLDDIIDFIDNNSDYLSEQNFIVNHAGFEVESESFSNELMDLLRNTIDLLDQKEIVPKDLLFLNQKISFLLGEINLDNTSETSALSQKDGNILVSLFKDMEMKNIDMKLSKDSDNQMESSLNHHKISLDNLEGMEILEEPELFALTDSIDSSVDSDMNSEMSFEDNDQHPEMFTKKTIIKDLRQSEKSTDIAEPFTLENIDAEISSTDTESLSVQSDNNLMKNVSKHDVSVWAQKMYSSLSSSVSRVQVEALMQNIAGKVSIILQDSGNELRMKLTPPELGQMKLSFVTEDGIMRGKVVVETSEAKMFFEQNIDNLRTSLAHAGIELGDINIDLGTHSEFLEDNQDESSNQIQAIRINNTDSQISEHRERKSMMETLVDFTA